MSSVPRFEIDRPVPRRPHYALRAGALGFVLGTVAAILAAGVFTIAAAGGTSGAVSQISPSEGAQSGSGTPDPHSAPQAPEGRAGPDNGADSSPEADTDLEAFSRSVNSDVQRAWEQTFAAKGMAYRPARLALYSGAVNTACGSASSAVGPFYCPADERVYIDPTFYSELRDRLGAPGDFAWAYVIAHEVGHHIQALTGVADRVEAAQRQNPGGANDLSVRLELQADCYAGVWGQSAYAAGRLEDGDLEEGLNAAAAVGDDRLQGPTGSIDPDSFTHGTSRQRVEWFRKGFDSGDAASCDTFGAASTGAA